MDAIQQSLRLAELIRKHLEQSLTAEEEAELASLRAAHAENDALFDTLTDQEEMEAGLQSIRVFDVEKGWARLQAAMVETQDVKPVSSRMWGWKLAAAVSGVVLISALLFRFWNPANNADQAPKTPQPLTDQIKPGKDRAYLVLADGTEILLDSAGNGDLALQGNTRIIKQGNNISYQNDDPNAAPVFNTIRTPRGGQFKLELADGSHVWLNAASSLRFPAAFSGDERLVQLSGEAYFEVNPERTRPFIVETGNVKISVTGTRFNVNAYPEEDGILTTLAEGGVRVTSKGNSIELKPEQEVRTGTDGEMGRVKPADLETTLAWKNGKFIFNAADVPSIMRQLGRWYDVDIVYAGPVSKETFTGMVSRQSDISRVLRIMEAGGIRFKIDKNKIVVE